MNLTRLAAEPGPVSLEDTSLDTWLNPTWGDPYIYYPKGSLVGLLLDIRIRYASDNRRSLDTVLRELYHDFYEQGRGFTTADLLGLLREAGVSDLDDFYRRYVDGRDPLPVAETLKLAGMRLEERDVSEPFLGVAGAPNEQGETVIGTIFPGSPAAEAGVEPGDVLLAVGDVRVEGVAEWPDRFRQAYAEKPGSPLEIRVRRNGAEQVLKTTVRLRTRQDFTVSRDPDAGRLEGEVFQGLVGGGGS
jgi:predicted metalloprotease with PDZ domain